MECRICYGDEGVFVHPCKCKGDTNVHEACLRKWMESSGRTSCEICNTEYKQKEIFSWQCNKVYQGCMQCKCTSTDISMVFLTFIMTIIVLMLSQIKDIFLLTAVSASTMFVSFIIFYSKDIASIDMLLWWKLAYSIPLWMIMFVEMEKQIDICNTECYLHHQQCIRTCPYYQKVDTAWYIVIKNIGFDAISIGVVLLCRTLIVCFKYNTKIVFDDYETKPLLTESDNQIDHHC